jgi:hypothetical protein
MVMDKKAQPPYCNGVMKTQNKLTAWLLTSPALRFGSYLRPDRKQALRYASELRRRGYAVRVRSLNTAIACDRGNDLWLVTNS